MSESRPNGSGGAYGSGGASGSGGAYGSGGASGRIEPLPRHKLDVPAPETLPFAMGTFDAIGPLSSANFPHRHLFYEIVLVRGGQGTHVIDFAEHPLRPPHLCFITPGQVHFWQNATNLRGRLLLFSDAFLLNHPTDRDALATLGERPSLHLSPDEAAEFATLVAQMQHEYERRGEGFISVLQAYLHVLIVRARRLPGVEPSVAASGRAAAVAQQFTRMLAKPGCTERSVRAYAARIGVSMSYLTEVVKEVTGHTPGQLIRQIQVLEAKRLLARTDLTVAQVAREVGFADAAYFSRFFRRETGASPGDFRRGVVEITTIGASSPSTPPNPAHSVDEDESEGPCAGE